MPVSSSVEVTESTELSKLRAECESLRGKLAKMEAEYAFFRKGFYDYERRYGEFANGDIDFDELARSSAGPVELL